MLVDRVSGPRQIDRKSRTFDHLSNYSYYQSRAEMNGHRLASSCNVLQMHSTDSPVYLDSDAELTAIRDARFDVAYDLSRSYELGHARPMSREEAWAWMRWAHDGCDQKSLSGTCEIEVRSLISADYLRLLKILTPEEMKVGDAYLCALMKECEVMSGKRYVPIFSVGGEGGSIELFAAWSSQGWRFFRNVHDWTPELLGEAAIAHQSHVANTWRGALKLMSVYPWHRLVCTEAHPEFGNKVWTAYNRRWRNTSGGRQRYRHAWKEACCRIE